MWPWKLAEATEFSAEDAPQKSKTGLHGGRTGEETPFFFFQLS